MLTFLSLQTQQETLDPERRMAKVQSFSSYCRCVVVLNSSLTLNHHSVDRQVEARELNESIETHIHQVCFTPFTCHISEPIPPTRSKNKNPRHFLLPSEVHKMVLSPLSGCLGVTGVNLSLCLFCFLHRAEQAPHPSGGYVTARSRRLIL